METLAPSRITLVLVGGAILVLGILAGIGVLRTAPELTLGTGERLLEPGPQQFTVGDVVVEAVVEDEPWVQRDRCPRWVQLNVLDDHATSVHIAWLDAIPEPAVTDSVRLVEPPVDVTAWWEDHLGLRLERLETPSVSGLPTTRVALQSTEQARVQDGLVACGSLGGPAATGLRGPAAGWRQEVTIVDVHGTSLMLVAAAWTGGDLDRSRAMVDVLVATAHIRVSAAAGATHEDG